DVGRRTDRTLIVGLISQACEGVGFMMVSGHGVERSLIDDFYRITTAFFERPLAEKLRASSLIRNRFQGYAAPGRGEGAQISERQSFNVQGFDSEADAIAAGYPADVGTSLFPAVWPAELPEFREIWR